MNQQTKTHNHEKQTKLLKTHSTPKLILTHRISRPRKKTRWDLRSNGGYFTGDVTGGGRRTDAGRSGEERRTGAPAMAVASVG
ncbi:hypothetical protein M5689_006253 [Euphorbia peplus]|nr:hypothetical protein M5689_006253 [Euphorbia peplus]